MGRGSGGERVLSIDASYDSVGAAVERAFEELLPRLEGKRVLLKPNMLLAWPPEWGATTHPSLVKACVEEVTRRGGRPVVGDTPSSGYLSRVGAVARKTGIAEAAGDRLRRIDEQVTEVRLETTGETVPFCRTALEADCVVTLPKMKTHSLTLLTGAVKNSYGLVAGGAKSRLHKVAPEPGAFARAVVDVLAVRPPDLAIVDAVVAMQGNGPTTKDLRPVGKLLASRCSVAVDAVMAHMMGLDPAAVPTLAEAEARGLGPARLEAIALDGEARPIPGFALPLTYRLGGLTSLGTAVAAGTFFASMSKPRLELRPGRCVGCAACALGCPTGAIAMERDAGPGGRGRPLPKLDRDRCIACLCCMEQCPEEAWAFSAWTRAMGGVGRVFSEELASAGSRAMARIRGLGRRGR